MPGTINEISNNKIKSKFHYNCLILLIKINIFIKKNEK